MPGATPPMPALRDLRAAVALDLAVRGANLAALVEITTLVPMPSLAEAWTLYQDTAREPELVASANPPHPLFMPLQFAALIGMSGAAPPGAGDELSLVVGGRQWAGWQRVSVTRSIGSIPANFDIQVTEHCPLAADVTFNPGDPCQVLISGDVVITGYVDRYIATISATAHTVRISGRSKSEDLVDCSAFVGSKDSPTFQVLGGTALSIAQQLAQPYGVAIDSIAGPGVQIPQFNIDFGQTPWEIIDRITRYSQLIAYDMPDGSVRLAQAGTESMASGFYQGQNVEQGRCRNSFNGRALFSEYEAHLFSSVRVLRPRRRAEGDAGRRHRAAIGGVPRFRRRYILCGAVAAGGSDRATDRAVWECNRRVRAAVRRSSLTCDTWRDIRGVRCGRSITMAPITYPIDLKVADIGLADRLGYLHPRRDRATRADHDDGAGKL